MKEEWRLIPTNKNYAISNIGNIVRWTPSNNYIVPPLRSIKILKNSKGYPRVFLIYDKKVCSKSIHSLVCEAFIGKRPIGYEKNHKDGNKLNNSVANL